jgi:hypothetical protein
MGRDSGGRCAGVEGGGERLTSYAARSTSLSSPRPANSVVWSVRVWAFAEETLFSFAGASRCQPPVPGCKGGLAD